MKNKQDTRVRILIVLEYLRLLLSIYWIIFFTVFLYLIYKLVLSLSLAKVAIVA